MSAGSRGEFCHLCAVDWSGDTRGYGIRQRKVESSLAKVTLGCVVVAAAAISSPTPAFAQHPSDNPVTSATDAFGLTVGLESTGIYGPTSVRGFSPQAAGNVRIEGLYFDEQGAL